MKKNTDLDEKLIELLGDEMKNLFEKSKKINFNRRKFTVLNTPKM
jgi:hypothetical protein